MSSIDTKTPRTTTQRTILEAARRLLVERGYHGVGLGEIAQAAGVSRQAVYLHFGSKAGLLRSLCAYVDEVEGIAELFSHFGRARNPEEVVDALAKVHVGITPRIFDIAAVLQGATRSDADAAAVWEEAGSERYGALRRVVERLARDGGLAETWTVDQATDFLWALTSIHHYEQLVVQRGWSLRRYERHLKTLFRLTLLGSTEPAPSSAHNRLDQRDRTG